MVRTRRVERGGEAVAAFGARFPPPEKRPGERRGEPGRPVDLAPASAYEALTRQLVEGLTEDLAEIKARLDGLLFMVAGAIVLDVALRLAGP